MPYKSDAQRRFFHSEGARKAGITPAMVAEWDEASRGQHVPEKVEKKADIVAWRLAKLAVQGMMHASKLPSPNPGPRQLGTAIKPETMPGSLNPRVSQEQFRSTASDIAHQASGAKLQAGESLTMPT